jgi:hypothetical protein
LQLFYKFEIISKFKNMFFKKSHVHYEAEDMTQEVELLSSRREALSSNPSTTKKMKKTTCAVNIENLHLWTCVGDTL